MIPMPLERIIFTTVFFFAFTLNAITGFAGGIITMPVGIATLGIHNSIAVMNVLGFCASAFIVISGFKHINWKEVRKITLTMVVFLILGIWLINNVPLDFLLRIYGIFIILVGLKNLIQKEQRYLPNWALWIVLALAGLIQGMFVSGGACLVIYAMQKFQDKDEFRASISMVWAILNFAYALYYFIIGNFTPVVFETCAICIPLLIIATLIGNAIAKRISQKGFAKFTNILLLIVGTFTFCMA